MVKGSRNRGPLPQSTIVLAGVISSTQRRLRNPRVHQRPATFGGHDQCLRGGLPFLKFLHGLGKLQDVIGGVLQPDQLSTAGQVARIVERAASVP
jgi:hypothetical protein